MLTCVGPMSLTVEDSALAFDLLKGPHHRDHMSLPADPRSYLAACRQPPDGLRIAYAPTLFDVPVDAPVAAAVEETVTRIAEDLPVTVTKVAPDWPDPREIFEILWAVGRGQMLSEAAAPHMAELDPGLARMIAGNTRYSTRDYITALKRRAALAGLVGSLFQTYDVLLLPTVPVLPFAADAPGPEERLTGRLVDWCNWTPFTVLFNLTQQPAASLPCGVSPEGLPVGLQVVGPRFGEAAVFRLCAAIERLMPWRQRLPDLLQRQGD